MAEALLSCAKASHRCWNAQLTPETSMPLVFTSLERACFCFCVRLRTGRLLLRRPVAILRRDRFKTRLLCSAFVNYFVQHFRFLL
jgi:hypothetical protein